MGLGSYPVRLPDAEAYPPSWPVGAAAYDAWPERALVLCAPCLTVGPGDPVGLNGLSAPAVPCGLSAPNAPRDPCGPRGPYRVGTLLNV